MLLDGLCHTLDGHCESSTQNVSLEVDQLEQTDDDCSVTQNDQKSIIFLAKECEEVESRFIISDTTSSSNNQLKHDDDGDQSYKASSLARVTTTTSSQSREMLKCSLKEGTEENHDGFQSPTNVIDATNSLAWLKCPPAPRKPKATPLTKRRKRERGNLEDEFVDEVELVLRFLSSEDDKKLKRARLLANSVKSMEEQ